YGVQRTRIADGVNVSAFAQEYRTLGATIAVKVHRPGLSATRRHAIDFAVATAILVLGPLTGAPERGGIGTQVPPSYTSPFSTAVEAVIPDPHSPVSSERREISPDPLFSMIAVRPHLFTIAKGL